jgi:hypothetical protein
MEEGAGAIKNKANDAEPNHHNKKLPRRSAHEPASVLAAATHVKAACWDGLSRSGAMQCR